MNTTDHGDTIYVDALNELPFVAIQYHEGQGDDLYAVGSSGWTPVDLGDRLRREADYADGIGGYGDADTFREAATELDVIEVYVADGRELPSYVLTMTGTDGREWVRISL